MTSFPVARSPVASIRHRVCWNAAVPEPANDAKRCARSPKPETISGPLWTREHLSSFIGPMPPTLNCPFPHRFASQHPVPLRSRDYSTPPSSMVSRAPTAGSSFVSFMDYAGAKQYEMARSQSLQRSPLYQSNLALSRSVYVPQRLGIPIVQLSLSS